MCHFDIACAISSGYGLLSLASLHVALQVAGRLHITLIKKAIDESGSGMALNCGAFENVHFVVLNIFNCWERFKEDINLCIPLLLQLC